MPKDPQRFEDSEGNTVHFKAGTFREKGSSIHMVIFRFDLVMYLSLLTGNPHVGMQTCTNVWMKP